jgi:hypothetical protein
MGGGPLQGGLEQIHSRDTLNVHLLLDNSIGVYLKTVN